MTCVEFKPNVLFNQSLLSKNKFLHSITRPILLYLNIPHPTDPNKTCPVCGKCFSTRHLVKPHFENVHLKMKKYKCKACGKQFYKKSDMKRHLEQRGHFESLEIPEDGSSYKALVKTLENCLLP